MNAYQKTQNKIEQENEIIKNLLTTAIEGGSNYWYQIDDHNKNEFPDDIYLSEMLAYTGARMTVSDVTGEEAFEPTEVTNADVLKAWHTFKTNPEYEHHFQDAINENDDATTGDVFFQLVVLKEVIFG